MHSQEWQIIYLKDLKDILMNTYLKLNSIIVLLLDVSFPFFAKFWRTFIKVNSVSAHQNNIHILAIEIYKVANGMSLEIMNDIFKLREAAHDHLRYATQFLTDPIHSVFNGSESASYLRPEIWENIRTEIKNKDFLVGFKKEIRKWKSLNCPCRIWKTFIANLWFYLTSFYSRMNIRICIFLMGTHFYV